MSKIPVKQYTISSQYFTSLAEAKKKLAEFYEQNPDRFNKKTRLFEVTEIFDVDIQEKIEVTFKKIDSIPTLQGFPLSDDRPIHPNCKNIEITPKKKGKKKNGL